MGSEPAGRVHTRGKALLGALKRTAKELKQDNLTIWAAALTYYSVLSLFPGLLVLVGVMGMLSDTFTATLLDNVTSVVPPAVDEILRGAVKNVEQSQARPGLATAIGLLLAFWSASGYVSAFMKASNTIYGVTDERPFWKLIPLRMGVTLITGALAMVAAIIIVLSGRVAEVVGGALGLEQATIKVWDVVKWPVLILIVSIMLATLYWAGPNARLSAYRWIRPGGVIAVLGWIAISFLFGLYVANFGSYNKTYGALAGVIVFLIWLWLTNLAFLIGAKIDSEAGEEA
ncbi:MAG TPA: YihY/virulence factor BrkB family protein [Candidatus Limnocylindrales bacterium]|nr:YihY/virulence factor BrkB family protein [Candidatus Limnocylindrales bacterium]